MIGFGLLMALQILREGVHGNDYYRLGDRPIALGISGAPGTGKSSLSKGLALIFGERTTVKLSGDDYSNWDGLSSMWKTSSHLDPKASRLYDMVKDFHSLMAGSAIFLRRFDRQTGYFETEKINKSRNVVLVEGLHTLYPRQMLKEFDVRIFIEMDEVLTSYFAMQNDEYIKDQTHKEMERVKSDGDNFIKPQAKNADLIFKISAVNSETLKNEVINNNLMMRTIIKNGIYYHDLARVLVGICGLQVNLEVYDEHGLVVFEVSGDVSSEDVSLAATMLIPHMDEMLSTHANFSNGIQGIMEIITLMELDQALKRRRVA